MKKKHKLYSKPKRPFDKQRIIDEAKLKKDFGLKNKKEIWKAEAKINSFRERAKKLVSAGEEEQKVLFGKLNKIGIKVDSIADVLSLEAGDLLKRRLQSILLDKGLANTTNHARQLITHKKVLVGENIVNVPSYIVSSELEDKIKLKQKPAKKSKKQEKGKEVEEESEEAEKSKETESEKESKEIGEKDKKERQESNSDEK